MKPNSYEVRFLNLSVWFHVQVNLSKHIKFLFDTFTEGKKPTLKISQTGSTSFSLLNEVLI